MFLSWSLRKAVSGDGPMDVARQNRSMAHTSMHRGRPETNYFATQGANLLSDFTVILLGCLIKSLFFMGYLKFQAVVKINLI